MTDREIFEKETGKNEPQYWNYYDSLDYDKALLNYWKSYALWLEKRSESNNIKLEVYQADFIPGFAAYVKNKKNPDSKPFIVLNVGSLLALVENKDIEKSELPYVVAECLMHEVFHALEDWANVEFSEDRVEALIEKYREMLTPPDEAKRGRG